MNTMASKKCYIFCSTILPRMHQLLHLIYVRNSIKNLTCTSWIPCHSFSRNRGTAFKVSTFCRWFSKITTTERPVGPISWLMAKSLFNLQVLFVSRLVIPIVWFIPSKPAKRSQPSFSNHKLFCKSIAPHRTKDWRYQDNDTRRSLRSHNKTFVFWVKHNYKL